MIVVSVELHSARTGEPVKDCASLTDLIGREATPEQCATHAYRWLTWFDPEHNLPWGWDCGDCTVEPYTPPAAVPVPASAMLMFSALILLSAVRGIQYART